MTTPREHAEFLRPAGLVGVEVLRAHFITHAYLPHAHDTLAVALIDQGAERYRYRGEALVATAGQVAVVIPGEVHTGAAATPEGWRYRVAYLDAAWLPPEVYTHGFRAPVLSDPELRAAWQTAHAALTAPVATPLGRETLLRGALDLLLTRWGGANWQPPRADPAAVRDTRAYLDAHPETSLNLSALAARVGLSPSHLSRSFREAVGAPPHAYLLGVRAARARDLLRAGQAISAVAVELGFADQAHLTRVFRRVMGVPPGAYLHAAHHSSIVQDRDPGRR